MTFPHPAARQAVPPAGDRTRRWLAIRPLSVVAVCAATALTAAACGSSGHGGNGGNSSSGQATSTSHATPASHAMPASQALSLAASQAQKVTSFSATMDISSTGAYSSHLHGSVVEQVKPTVLAQEKLNISAKGQHIPGGMEAVLTSNAMYLKLSRLTRAFGRSWVKISFAKLRGSTGISLAPLIHQLQGNNPLAEAQMLPAATQVHQVGTATINGVPTTAYAGTLNLAAAMSRLDPSLRKLFSPALSAAGITTAHFTAWIDGRHLIRKLVEDESGASTHVTTVMVINSINQPVHISVPPASQVASLPGL